MDITQIEILAESAADAAHAVGGESTTRPWTGDLQPDSQMGGATAADWAVYRKAFVARWDELAKRAMATVRLRAIMSLAANRITRKLSGVQLTADELGQLDDTHLDHLRALGYTLVSMDDGGLRITRIVRCECSDDSGSDRCQWEGDENETVEIMYTPMQHRGTAEALGDMGWQMEECITVHEDCVDAVLTDEWARRK